MSVSFYNDVSDARFKGEIMVVINSNFRIVPAPVYRTGSQGGTFQMQNDQCTWQGTWMGYREANGFTYLSGVGQGQCGNDRLQVHWMGKRLDPDNTQPIDVKGDITYQ